MAWDDNDGHGQTMRWHEGGAGPHQPLGAPSYTYFQALALALKERRDAADYLYPVKDDKIFTMDYNPLTRWTLGDFNAFDRMLDEAIRGYYWWEEEPVWLKTNSITSERYESLADCAAAAGYLDGLIKIADYHPLGPTYGSPTMFAPFTAIYLIQRYKILNLLRYQIFDVRSTEGRIKSADGYSPQPNGTWGGAETDTHDNWAAALWGDLSIFSYPHAHCNGHYYYVAPYCQDEGDPPKEVCYPAKHSFSMEKSRSYSKFIVTFNLEKDHKGAFYAYAQKFGNEWIQNNNGTKNTWNLVSYINEKENDLTLVSKFYMEDSDPPITCSAPAKDEDNSGGVTITDAKFVCNWFFDYRDTSGD